MWISIAIWIKRAKVISTSWEFLNFLEIYILPILTSLFRFQSQFWPCSSLRDVKITKWFFYHYNMWFHNSLVMHFRWKKGKLEKVDFEAQAYSFPLLIYFPWLLRLVGRLFSFRQSEWIVLASKEQEYERNRARNTLQCPPLHFVVLLYLVAWCSHFFSEMTFCPSLLHNCTKCLSFFLFFLSVFCWRQDLLCETVCSSVI